jgi:DNA-binding XRE family transcriptional regulator
VQIGVDKTTVCNWESNASLPAIRYIPAILQFLGYDPFPPAQTLAERLTTARKVLGLSQQKLALLVGVDPRQDSINLQEEAKRRSNNFWRHSELSPTLRFELSENPFSGNFVPQVTPRPVFGIYGPNPLKRSMMVDLSVLPSV